MTRTNKMPFSNTTLFLLPVFGLPTDLYKDAGLIDCFINDSSREYVDPCVVLVMEGNQGDSDMWNGLQEALCDHEIDIYPYENLVVWALRIPAEFLDDYYLILEGKYGDLSEAYRKVVGDKPELDKLGLGKKLQLLIAERHMIVYEILGKHSPNMAVSNQEVWEPLNYFSEVLTQEKLNYLKQSV